MAPFNKSNHRNTNHLRESSSLISGSNCTDVRLTCPQGDQSLVAGIGDSDNSLSMRWVKLGSTGCMNHADGAGGGTHVAATGWILEED